LVLNVLIPAQTIVLPTGLRVVLERKPYLRSVSFAFWVAAGSRQETEDEGGAAHFVEHLLFRGSERRPSSFELADGIERLGGYLNGETGKEHAGYVVQVASEHARTALDVVGDLVLRPLLRPADVRTERRIVLEEIAASRDVPADRIWDVLQELLWPAQPLGRSELGTSRSLKALDREKLSRFHRTFYRPEAMVLSAVGAIDEEEFLSWAAEWGQPNPAPSGPSFAPCREAQEGPALRVEERRAEETHFCLAFRAFGRRHPDRYALVLLQTILGEGMSSRLFQEVRDRRGLAYEVHAECMSFSDAGALVIYAGVDRRRGDQALAQVLVEVDRLRQTPVSPRELESAKERVLGGLLLQLEDPAELAEWLGLDLLLDGRLRTFDEVAALVRGIGSDDVLRVAQACLRPERANLAVVGRPLEFPEPLF
jgi:predicted Zn-dependent peptidase